MLRIGEFSKLCRVTVKTLRYYDEIGLLKPNEISGETGYRYYKTDQLNIMSEILSFKKMGLSLDEISCLIKNNLNPAEVHNMLLKKQEQILMELQLEQEKLAKVHAYIKSIEEEKVMNQVFIKELPEVIVASFRTIILDYDALHTVVPEMGVKMTKHGAVCREPAYCFNIYHDGEYKETEIDVEICEAVRDYCENSDGVEYKKIAGVETAASIFHQGPYSTIGKSYATLLEWIKVNGYSIDDNPREAYIDGCWNKSNPEEWLTEIQIPVRR